MLLPLLALSGCQARLSVQVHGNAQRLVFSVLQPSGFLGLGAHRPINLTQLTVFEIDRCFSPVPIWEISCPSDTRGGIETGEVEFGITPRDFIQSKSISRNPQERVPMRVDIATSSAGGSAEFMLTTNEVIDVTRSMYFRYRDQC